MTYKREKTARCLRDDQLGKMWKIAAVALAACVAVAALAWFRPWEGVGVRQEPRVEEEQPPIGWFGRGTILRLDNTEDNLPIKNVEIRMPFPEEFENLRLAHYALLTMEHGYITFSGAHGVVTNTLVGRNTPVFTVENTAAGMRAVLRITKMYPGDEIIQRWGFMAQENAPFYEVPNENRMRVLVNFAPGKIVDLKLRIGQNWVDLRGFHQMREWWRRISGTGWIDAPSENIPFPF